MTTTASPTADRLVSELLREAGTTRKVLERVPEDRLSWRPDPKSMSLGQLALHIAGLPRGITDLLKELVAGMPTVPVTEAESRQQILDLFDGSLEAAKARITEWGEEGLAAEWRMVMGEDTLLALPRRAMVRTLILNHTYHHRGQLTVYLRLLGVPVPPVYGPTADESPFG